MQYPLAYLGRIDRLDVEQTLLVMAIVSPADKRAVGERLFAAPARVLIDSLANDRSRAI